MTASDWISKDGTCWINLAAVDAYRFVPREPNPQSLYEQKDNLRLSVNGADWFLHGDDASEVFALLKERP